MEYFFLETCGDVEIFVRQISCGITKVIKDDNVKLIRIKNYHPDYEDDDEGSCGCGSDRDS